MGPELSIDYKLSAIGCVSVHVLVLFLLIEPQNTNQKSELGRQAGGVMRSEITQTKSLDVPEVSKPREEWTTEEAKITLRSSAQHGETYNTSQTNNRHDNT